MSKAKPRKSTEPAKPTAAALSRQLARVQLELAKSKAAIADLETRLAKATAPKVDPVPKTLAEFKTPPDDPLHAAAELYRMMVLSAYDAATDPKISAATRRKELRTITASAAKLFPESRRWEVEKLIREDREAIAKRASEKTSAKLEPRRPQ